MTKHGFQHPDPVRIFRHSIFSLISRDEGCDLTTRQLGVLLHVYGTEVPQTVRGLSTTLRVSKPAITRALDKLGSLGLIKRRTDPEDRRSVLTERTPCGENFISDLRAVGKAVDAG